MADFPVAPGPGPLPSGDPVLPTDIVNGSIVDKMRSMLTDQQMQAMTSDPRAQDALQGVMEKVIGKMISETLLKMDASGPKGHATVTDLQNRLASPDQKTRLSAADEMVGYAEADHAASPMPEGRPAVAHRYNWATDAKGHRRGYASEEEMDQSIVGSYQEGREMSMGTIGRHISGMLATSIQNRETNWVAEQDANGNNTGDYVQYDPSTYDPTDPNSATVLDRVSPGDPRYRNIGLKAKVGGKIAANLKSIAGEGRLAGALGSIGKVAGPVGMAVGAVDTVRRQLEKQNDQATFYKQAFGDQGTGNFAASDRMSERWHSLGGFGSIGMDRARDEFRGASALGLRGDRRDEAIGFSRDMYKTLGLDTNETMDIVSDALKQGNVSLRDYATALKEVSKAAVEGGRSSAEAVRDYREAQKYVASNIAGGAASLGITSNIDAITAGMSQQTITALGGTKGLAQTLGNQQSQYMVAAQLGQDPMASRAQLAAGGATAEKQSQTLLSGGADQLVERMAGHFGLPSAQLRSDAQGAAVGGTVSNGVQATLWMKWSGGAANRAGVAYQVLSQLMRMYGYQVGSDEANRGVFFSMLVGQFDKKADSKDGATSSTATSGVHYKKGDSKGNLDALRRSLGMGPTPTAGQMNTGGRGANASAAQGVARDNAPLESYLKNVVDKNGGHGDAAIEALLRPETQAAIKADTGKSAADQKYVVNDGGQHKSVSLEEIMKNPSYRAQMDAGTVQVQGMGRGNVKNVSEYTHVEAKGGSSTATSSGGAGGSGGGYLISPTPELRRWLKVTGPTDNERQGIPAPAYLNPDNIFSFGGN